MQTVWNPEARVIIAHESKSMRDIYMDIRQLRNDEDKYRCWSMPIKYISVPDRLVHWVLEEGTSILYKRDKRDWEQ